MPNWSNLNNSASNFSEKSNYQLCEKMWSKAWGSQTQIPQPLQLNPTLMISIQLDWWFWKLHRQSLPKPIEKIFIRCKCFSYQNNNKYLGKSKLQVSPTYHQRPPKNRTHLKHSKSLTFKKSKLSEFSTKCQSLNHQERSQENQGFLKVPRWKFNKIIPKTKTFFPLWVSILCDSQKERLKCLSSTDPLFFLRKNFVLKWGSH